MVYSRDFPDHTANDQYVLATLADSEAVPKPPRSSRWLGWLMIAGTLGIVLIPLLCLGLPGEISQWYVAAAIESRLDGDQPGAERNLDKALAWDPKNGKAHACRGDWKLEEGDYEACLQDYERALALEPDDPAVLPQRTIACQYLGRHDQAIADWKKLVAGPSAARAGRRAVYLNGLAYAQALGNRELQAALQNVDQALTLVSLNSAMLDTRGYIYYLRGDLKAAERDMAHAVTMAEQDLKDFIASKEYLDHREFVQQQKEMTKSVAVIRYHRALVYQALVRHEEAEQDLKRVRDLGYEPGEKLF
jgi:tetratricopeptide (TPR) repeat protein